eukprot:6722909-Prymnesium_polylepis.1
MTPCSIMLAFVWFPFVTSLAFRAFVCECWDGERAGGVCLLKADYQVVTGRIRPLEPPPRPPNRATSPPLFAGWG